MSDFKRELRYFIFKTKHLTQEQREQLLGIADSINHPPLECVVVESDWPNYEDTWKAVEQVANGEYQSPYDLIEQLQQRNAELTATVERLRYWAYVYQQNIGPNSYGLDKEDKSAWEEIEALLSSTPQQNLNAVKREVARKAWDKALDDFARLRGQPNLEDSMCIAKANYLQRIKDGE